MHYSFMRVTEIAFSAYPATDLARARAFYEGLLGLKPTMISDTPEGRWIEYDIGSGTLAIGCIEGWMPASDGCCAGLEMEDFDGAIAEFKAAGTPFKMGPCETPVCRMALVSDPDGNTLIIHKRKPVHA